MSAWQPIDTVSLEQIVTLAEYRSGNLRWLRAGRWNSHFNCWQSLEGSRIDGPTHWQPLQEPPA